ncbi:MAG: aminopeptidase P family protein [Spirochaetales bacterium]|nr:aminopeptidase P family protein [Spirochaetales bacterium]
MDRLPRLFEAIRGGSLAGWLFYNQHHHDEIADRILGIDRLAANTRPWLCLCSARGDTVKLVPAVEPGILDRVPGRTVVYRGREEFDAKLAGIGRDASGPGAPWAADFSDRFPRLSFLDHGFALRAEAAGFRLASADELIPAVLSLLSDEELSSHEEAARALRGIVDVVWERIASSFRGGKKTIREGDVHGWIMELFERHNLETDGPLIVGAGRNTSLPHYFPGEAGEKLERGRVVQLDMWGKLKRPDAVYADISWSGFLGSSPPAEVERAFRAVREARDGAVAFIAGKLERGETVTGAEADACAEESLTAAGYGGAIRHRTGHSIDAEVHGFGVNLDSREFPDTRPLAERTCFSVEPGVYLDDFGIRSEIDVYIKNERPVISGGTPQRELLLLQE